MSKTRIWVILVLAFTLLLGWAIMAVAEEQIVNGSTNVAIVFDVYGASSGDPCLTATVTAWNLQYYRDNAADKDVNNATAATLGTHADNTIVTLGAGKWWACFPDTCFDGGVNTKVHCWLTSDANAFICPAITVLLIPNDYNSVSLAKNVDVKYVRGETPEADVVDTLLDVNDNLGTEIAAVQTDVDTIEGYLDTEIADMPSAVWDVDLTTKTVRNTAGWILNALKQLLF